MGREEDEMEKKSSRKGEMGRGGGRGGKGKITVYLEIFIAPNFTN